MLQTILAALALAIAVDGKLDEPDWRTAKWDDGVAILSDSDNVYLGVQGGRRDVYLAPTGNKFSYYRYSLRPSQADCKAEFYSEGGVIQPDPFAPRWSYVKSGEGSATSYEVKIPLSSFYMTRNKDWAASWLVRHDDGPFKKTNGFPKRAEEDDVFIRLAEAKIDEQGDAGLKGALRVAIQVAKGGDFTLRTSAGRTDRKISLRAGENSVEVPCRYPKAGRHLTHFVLTRCSDGRKTGRSYPVMVDFERLAVRLTQPYYRNNFYPGQDSAHVSGTVSVPKSQTVSVTLRGPGFATQTTNLVGGGSFAFDTRNFQIGDAELTVASGSESRRIRIRNLPDTGHRMVWVENGHLVVNGKPVLRRNLYADGWMCGEAFLKRYESERDQFHKTPEFEKYVDVQPGRLVPGLEEREARRDVRPCAEYFAKVDEVIAKNANEDFGFYYLIDEPECRHISPVYLKFAYDYIAAKDPYHPILTASRGGKAYIECVDWAETHPYLDCYNDEDGRRKYNFAPNEMGRFLDAFEAADRPDKVIGFLPTCFAYRWESPRHDYPTFDEYVLHTWAAMMRGGKSLWPYAGHDLGDRPALYEGTKYIFSSFDALSSLVLEGRRTVLRRSADDEAVLYELPDEKMLVAVNFTEKPRKIALSGACGNFREFRGKRSFVLSGSADGLILSPLETVVACTRTHDQGLPLLADVKDVVRKDEERRIGRDNQLRGQYESWVLSSNMKLRGAYKLIDGTRDMLAGYSDFITNAYLEASFVKFVPRFSRLLLWGKGEGVEKMAVSVRSRGTWRRLSPRKVVQRESCTELDFGEVIETVKLRIDFPGVKGQRNEFEFYELELPKVKGLPEKRGNRVQTVHTTDVGVKWRLDGGNAGDAYGPDGWMTEKPGVFSAAPTGGLLASDHFSRRVKADADHRWLVFDFAAFHEKSERGYRAWCAYMNDIGLLGGTVTVPQPGLYTIRLPEELEARDYVFRFYTYGLTTEFNSIALMEKPANRVELDYEKGIAKVRVRFSRPCEDVSAEFLVARSTGNLKPFAVNGTHGIDLRPMDDDLCIWGADIDVRSCGAAKAREVYVKVSALGGGFERPVYGNFAQKFEERR